MRRLITAENLQPKKRELTAAALLRLCLGALGVLVGLAAARRHRREAGVLAGILFVVTYIPLMGRFLRALADPGEK